MGFIFLVLIVLFVCKPTKDFAFLICFLAFLTGKFLLAIIFLFLFMAGSNRSR
jgi:hypothetical protein